MSNLSFNSQFDHLKSQVARRINSLRENDPIKGWFLLELEQLLGPVASHDSLPEINARILALKQLSRLVYQHRVRIQNPVMGTNESAPTASFHTIEARLPSNVLESARAMRFSIEPELLHDAPERNEQFDPVSPTARIVGFLRGLDQSLNVTDELCMKTQGQSMMDELNITNPDTQTAMAVLFQSRYHAMNAAMANSKAPVLQIIEFAAGISPRGYQWSSMSPGTIYVESDLPQLMVHKAKLIRNTILAKDENRLGLLHCCAVDVLNLESVLKALETLDLSQPFTMVTEGLLLYFGSEEMNNFLSNMKHLLNRFPKSVWITDLVTKTNLKELFSCDKGVAAGVRKVFQMAGRNVVPDNPFLNDDCIARHLETNHLSVDSSVSLSDVTGQLKFSMDYELVKRKQIVGTRKIWRIVARR